MPPYDLSSNLDDINKRIDRLEGTIAGWQQSNHEYPLFPYMVADQGNFKEPPLDFAFLLKSIEQGIPNQSWTTINNIVGYRIRRTGMSHTTESRFDISGVQLREETQFLVTGVVRWQDNSSGERRIRFVTWPYQEHFLLADPATYSVGGGRGLASPFSFVWQPSEGTTGFSFQVWQNGEAPELAISYFSASVIIVGRKKLYEVPKRLAIQPPVQLAWVDSTGAASTWGGSTLFIRAREIEGGGGGSARRSFVQFDLSRIPSNINIVSATLHLFQTAEADNTSAADSIDVYRVESSWNAGTITWNNQPGVVSSKISSHVHPTGSTNIWNNFTFSTAEFAAMISSNYGVMLRFANEDIGSTNMERMEWVGSAAEPFFERLPRLTVYYTET